MSQFKTVWELHVYSKIVNPFDSDVHLPYHIVVRWKVFFSLPNISNRNCLGQFREIPRNQTTDVHQGSTLITRVIA